MEVGNLFCLPFFIIPNFNIPIFILILFYILEQDEYKNSPIYEEEYIDLIPILENLYINVEEFLKSISKVEI
ncbi:DUF7724 family protein [Thomasclavelia cocleata]|uniref:DUF7724 family protein n=1 Tax=Thomasclavelia cocleata TaxID=69824 RepID=UPI003F73C7F0